MAHVVGVPKRDPCLACGLPVFLAERLTIPGVDSNGQKRVYHRTCLRCARCKSQLTPGSFYETEIDGEYCCETCPDEEKPEDVVDKDVASGSISSRLAFFENDGKKVVLQKSLSDEEKSQSLKKITETEQNVYKQNPALSKFMNSHLVDSKEPARAGPSGENSRRSSTDSTSTEDVSVSEEIVPKLPTSLPPVISKDIPESRPSTTFTSTMSLSLDSQNDSQHDTQQISSDKTDKKPKSTNEQIQSIVSKTSLSDKPQQELSPTPIVKKTSVTKDISDTDEKMRTSQNNVSISVAEKSEQISNRRHEEIDNNFDDISKTNRSSMVRDRLHQFEIMSNSNSPFSSLSSSVSKDADTVSREAVGVAELTSIDSGSSSISSSRISISDNKTDEKSQSIPIETNIDPQPLETEVPKIASKDSEIISSKDSESQIDASCPKKSTEEVAEQAEESVSMEKNETTEELENTAKDIVTPRKASNVNIDEDYPEDLNPFKSDEEDEAEVSPEIKKSPVVVKRIVKSEDRRASKDENRKSLNPFDSSDDEAAEADAPKKVKPPRPPPPKLKSTNPFGSEDDEEEEASIQSMDTPKRRPVPTPRSYANSSQNTTPEPTPRLSRQNYGAASLTNIDDQYGSNSSLMTPSTTGAHSSSENLRRGGDVRGSSNSIGSSTSSLSGGKYRKGRKAPPPPTAVSSSTVKELFPSAPQENHKISPQSRKKRPAPLPPPPVVVVRPPSDSLLEKIAVDQNDYPIKRVPSELPHTDDVKVAEEKLSDEEKLKEVAKPIDTIEEDVVEKRTRRLISIDASLLDDSLVSSDSHPKEDDTVVYRRTIAPLVIENSADEEETESTHESHDRQLEKLKDNKEAKNRNRQSQISLSNSGEENDPLFNKSIHGKWKRRKGPAPALPVPPRRVLQMLPLQEIRHELEIIEVQQQGLEKQGVMLEKMIRERCEGPESGSVDGDGNKQEVVEEEPAKTSTGNSKEVEDLILQLFELVNEKNELFRRQAELMYLRRQHRLEQEQADLEYEIRVLMAQPERNKTDSDKAREEALIARLVEVVQLRNEVIECLEMDRLREAEEDLSIKQRLELHAAKRDEELSQQTPTKLSKKEKKRQKEVKKLGKSKKFDADKDADETELAEKKDKKKRKTLLSSVISFK